MPKVDVATRAPIQRLPQVATGRTGQAGTTAASLLAWWNVTSRGGFDLTDLWTVGGHRPRHAFHGRLHRNASGLPGRLRSRPQFEQMVAL